MLITRISVYDRIWSSILLINTKSIMVPHLPWCSFVLNSNTLFLKFKTVKFYQFVRYVWRYFQKCKSFWFSGIFFNWHFDATILTQKLRRSESKQLIYIFSVTFKFKFPTYKFLQFCFSCWLDWYFCFWVCWSTSWRFFWWCLFWWCCWKLSLVGWASSVRCNSGLSFFLVCYFANDAAWLFCSFAKDSDSTIADCVSNKLFIISFSVSSSICKNFILSWSASIFLHWSLNTLTLFYFTSDNKSKLLFMIETLHVK